MDCDRFTNNAELSTAAVFACVKPTEAVVNSGHTTVFILRSLGQFGQQLQVSLLGSDSIQT